MMENQKRLPQYEQQSQASRRKWLACMGALGVAALGWRAAQAQDASGAQVVQVVAQRFAYSPSDIVVKAGRPIVLEVVSLDFAHGMSFPDLGVRADLVPGKLVRIALPAQPAGVVDFLCDNFCGDEHEAMHGRLVVQA